MLQELRRVLNRRALATPAAGAEQDRTFYDRRYQQKAQKRLPYHLSHYYALWTVIADRVCKSDGVLEVGCGAGQLAALMSDQGLRQYTGFDFSSAAVSIARELHPGGKFVEADAFETDLFRTARYDPPPCTKSGRCRRQLNAPGPRVLEAMQRWADDDLRSLNGQIDSCCAAPWLMAGDPSGGPHRWQRRRSRQQAPRSPAPLKTSRSTGERCSPTAAEHHGPA